MKTKKIITTLLTSSIIILLLVGCGGKSTAKKLAEYGEEQFLTNDFNNYLENIRACGLSDLTAEISSSYIYEYDFNKKSKELLLTCQLMNLKSDMIDEYYTIENNQSSSEKLANLMILIHDTAFSDKTYTYESKPLGKVTVRITNGYSSEIHIKTSQGRDYEYSYYGDSDIIKVGNKPVYNKKARNNNTNTELPSSITETNVTNDDELGTCWALAKDVVKANLKSPSSAKFPFSYGSDGVSITNSGNIYTVQAWVDAENSFGANLRSNFIVTMEKSGSGKNAKFTSKSCVIE